MEILLQKEHQTQFAALSQRKTMKIGFVTTSVGQVCGWRLAAGGWRLSLTAKDVRVFLLPQLLLVYLFGNSECGQGMHISASVCLFLFMVLGDIIS